MTRAGWAPGSVVSCTESVSPGLQAHAGLSDFFLNGTSRAIYVLDAILNIAHGTLLNVVCQPGWEGDLGGEWVHVYV